MSPVIVNESTTKKASIEGSDIPDAFICPLTMNIMVEPMASKYGHNYERDAIMEWIEKEGRGCPMTRQPLVPSMLITNSQLQSRIRVWLAARGEKVSYDLEQEAGYRVLGDKYNHDLDGGDLTDSETEDDSEIDAEIDARIAAIIQTMLSMEEQRRISQQIEGQGHEVQQQESISPKKSRKSRGFLGRFGRKSKR